MVQERSKSGQTRQLIDHEETNQWILNQNSLHNYQEIAAVLPSDLAPYVPSVEKCDVLELRRHAAMNIRSKKNNTDGQFGIVENDGIPAPAFDKNTRSRKKKPAGNPPLQHNSPQQQPNPQPPMPETPIRSLVGSAIPVENTVLHLRNPTARMETSDRHSNHYPPPLQARNPPLQQGPSAVSQQFIPYRPLLPTYRPSIPPLSHVQFHPGLPSHQAMQPLSIPHPAPLPTVHTPMMAPASAPHSPPSHPTTLQQHGSFLGQHQSASFQQQRSFPGQHQSSSFQLPLQGPSHSPMSALQRPLPVHPQSPTQWLSTTPLTLRSFPADRIHDRACIPGPVSQPTMLPQGYFSTGQQFTPLQPLPQNRQPTLMTAFHQPPEDDTQSSISRAAGLHSQWPSATPPAPQSVLQTGYLSQQYQVNSSSRAQSFTSLLETQYPMPVMVHMEYPTTDAASLSQE